MRRIRFANQLNFSPVSQALKDMRRGFEKIMEEQKNYARETNINEKLGSLDIIDDYLTDLLRDIQRVKAEIRKL